MVVLAAAGLGAGVAIAGGQPSSADQAVATVPSFRGMTVAEAQAAGASVGVGVFGTPHWRVYPGRPGRVISQDTPRPALLSPPSRRPVCR